MIYLYKSSVLALLMILSSVNMSVAAPQDYHFEVSDQPIKAAHEATIEVQVTQISTHKPVTNAAITSQKLHMMMGSMDEETKIQALPQDEKGKYRFNADLTMYGEWTLDIVASLPGEKEPIRTSLKMQVVK